MVDGAAFLGSEPLAADIRPSESLQGVTDYIAPAIAPAGGAIADCLITLINTSDEEQDVTLLLLDGSSGDLQAAHELTLGTAAGETLSLPATWPEITDWSTVYLRARTVSPGLVAVGSIVLPDGDLVELPFFSNLDPHGTGSYPLPGLDEHDVQLQLLNVSSSASIIGAELAWPGGSYSLGSFDLPAGTRLTLDPAALVEGGAPDEREVLDHC